jgi:hypothetical protein
MMAPAPAAVGRFALAGFVGVADTLNAREAGALDISHGVADEHAFAWIGIERLYRVG